MKPQITYSSKGRKPVAMAFFVLLDKIAIQNATRWTMTEANNEFAEEMEMVSRVRGVWHI